MARRTVAKQIGSSSKHIQEKGETLWQNDGHVKHPQVNTIHKCNHFLAGVKRRKKEMKNFLLVTTALVVIGLVFTLCTLASSSSSVLEKSQVQHSLFMETEFLQVYNETSVFCPPPHETTRKQKKYGQHSWSPLYSHFLRRLTVFLLAFFTGTWGVDRFYTGHIAQGVIKLLTLGGAGLWSFVDW